MPITSHQVSGMIGGQQAMFGNFASYSQQISPGFQGSPPTYANPMAGAGGGFSPAPSHLQDASAMARGPEMMSAIGNIGMPALGTAAMLGGAMLPGAAGRAIGGLDPFTGGLKGFAGGAGLSGGQGIMSNMGRIASGGFGSIARAGLGGIGGAVAGFMPMYAAGKAAQFGVGQMVQGAQFQNQVQGTLDQNFRFQNNASQSGYGFSREQGGQIADMVRDMGHSDMMSGPQEMLRIMKSGTQQGLFRAVQDVKEFKKRFTDMVGALKEVSKTMNTTLEGAMPFFSQARQMGFWTPNDIAKNAQQVRQTAASSGMSIAQTQQMMAQGSQMARSVGARGAAGAQGMAQSMGLVGGAMRSGYVSEQEMSEATGGLTGGAAVQSMSGTIQAGATRFARSRKARWLLASMGTNGFKSLDPGKMQDLMSGNMSLGDISRGARRNIGQQGAFNFVNNEQELRGELLKQGPGAQFGFMRAMTGEHLYGGDARSKLITRRLLKRNFGFNNAQADVAAKMARNSSQIMRENITRGEASTDQQERDREQLLNRSWEGVKRKASNWIDKTVKEPLQGFGADISQAIGDYFERMGDKMWGRVSAQDRFRGITGSGIDALKRGALGDTRAMETTFGKPGALQKAFGGLGGGGDLGVGGTMDFSKGGGITRAWEGKRGGFMNALKLTLGAGGEVANDKMDVMLRMGAKERSFGSAEARDAAVRKGGLYAGRMVGGDDMQGTSDSYRAFEKEEIDRIRTGMGVGISGKVYDQAQASALGFEDEKGATAAIQAAQKEVGSTAFQRASMRLPELRGKTGIELAKAQIKAIESGKMGNTAGIKAMFKGKDMAQKISLLSAASVASGGGRGALDLREEAKAAGIGTFSGLEDLESQLASAVESGMSGLGAAMSEGANQAGEGIHAAATATGMDFSSKSALKPVPGSAASMDKILKYGKGEFREAMRLLSYEGSAEDMAENKKKAEDILTNLARTEKRFTSADVETLLALTDTEHPNHKNIKSKIKSLGNVFAAQESAKFTEATMRRGARLFTRMGEEKGQVMGALDKVKDAKGNSIGQLVRKLQDNTDDPTKYLETMKEITMLAENAPEGEVSRAADVLQEYGGGFISNLLRGGRGLGKTMKRLTGKSVDRAAGAATDVMGDLLGKAEITGQDMPGIRAGDTGTIEKILENVPKDNKDRVRQILTSMGKGAKEGESLEELVRQQTTSQSADMLGEGADNKDKMQLIGRLGSSAGIHQTIADGNRILENLLTEVRKGRGKPGTDNFAEDPDK